MYGSGVENDTPYFAMEFVEGETLAQVLEKTSGADDESETPFGPRNRQDFFVRLAAAIADVAEGLHHAHSKGVTHRDIKPSNLILDGDGRLRILDFGLASTEGQESLTLTGDLVGTVLYMSPEQAMAKRARPDHRTDIYSLGASLYEMVTGEPPFRGRDQHETLSQIITRDPRPPRQLNPRVPRNLETIALKCLRKDPNDRYGSAEALGQDLRRFVRGDPIEARPPGRFERCWSWTRSRRTTLVYTAALFILLIFGSLSLIDWRRMRNETRFREVTFPQIKALYDQGARRFDFGMRFDALNQAQEALEELPIDSGLSQFIASISVRVTINTVPQGARVSVRPVADPQRAWSILGRTPLSERRILKGPLMWRIEWQGFEELILIRDVRKPDVEFHLEADPGMVMVPANGPVPFMPAFETARRSPDSYLIDRYEVTNEEYQEFVDAGGYAKRDYWTDLIENVAGDWRTVVAGFRDGTGRSGPLAWIEGKYPTGQARYPVGGVSWYEAAAYARYAGKSLPTVYHWNGAAAASTELHVVNSQSNIDPQGDEPGGPAPVGQGPGPYGTFDMAGNVREWCWNETADGERYTLGGSWADPGYQSYLSEARSPLFRESDCGFRCVKYLSETPPAELTAAVRARPRDYTSAEETPCSDAEFEFLRHHYSYESQPLNARIEKSVEFDAYTFQEVVFDSVYDERDPVRAHLFLPRRDQFVPPYQAVIYFQGSTQLYKRKRQPVLKHARFLLDSGRAVLAPIFYASFERGRDQLRSPFPNRTVVYSDVLRNIARDFSRSVDYLKTREDIDADRLGYYGYSWGAELAPIFLGAYTDQGIKAAILQCAGLPRFHARREVDPIHFVPRVRAAVLLASGALDVGTPVETSQQPLFDLLELPASKKRLKIYKDMGHWVPQTVLGPEGTQWLDAHLGPVRRVAE